MRCISCAHAPFPVSFCSCSTVTARTTPLITGFIKRRVKEDTGGTKRLIEERGILRKAAPGRRERSTPKKKAARSPKMKGKEDTKRKDIRKAFPWRTRGTEAAWTGKSGHRKRSRGKGSSRCVCWCCWPGHPRRPGAGARLSVASGTAESSPGQTWFMSVLWSVQRHS